MVCTQIERGPPEGEPDYQNIRETVNPDGSIERCEDAGFETHVRTECRTVPETVCETVNRIEKCYEVPREECRDITEQVGEIRYQTIKP